MFWVVQSNLHRVVGHARLLAALDRAGSRYAEVQVLPFTDALVPADLWAVALGHARAATTRRSAEFFLTLDSTGVYALPPTVRAAPPSSTPCTVSLAAAARLAPNVARWLADTFTLDPAAADVAFAALTARR